MLTETNDNGYTDAILSHEFTRNMKTLLSTKEVAALLQVNEKIVEGIRKGGESSIIIPG